MGRRLGRPPTTLRLWAAAALCAVPLGLPWSTSAGTFTIGFTIYGSCNYADPGDYCTTDAYIPGTYFPGSDVTGAGSPARVFLVFTAIVLAWVATRPRTPGTRRWARLAVAGAGFALVLAVSERAVTAALCLAAALLLAAPPAWRSPRRTGAFGNAPPPR